MWFSIRTQGAKREAWAATSARAALVCESEAPYVSVGDSVGEKRRAKKNCMIQIWIRIWIWIHLCEDHLEILPLSSTRLRLAIDI